MSVSPTNRRAYQPANSGRSLADTARSKKDVNPYELLPKVLAPKVGDCIYLRILNMDPDVARKIECVKVDKTTGKGTIGILIHQALIAGDPEEVVAENDLTPYVDEKGVPILESGKRGSIYRFPVWVYAISSQPTPRSKVSETEIGELRYLEVTWGIFSSILELRDNKHVDLSFDPNAGKPNYDIIISRNAQNGNDTWGVDADSKNSDTFRVDDAKALGAAAMKVVEEGWADMLDAQDVIMGEKDIRYALGTTAKKSTALGSRPTMPGAAEEGDTTTEQEPGEPATYSRSRGGSTSTATPATPAVPSTDEPAGGSVRKYQRRMVGANAVAAAA